MQTLLHKEEEKREHKKEQKFTHFKENYFRVVGLLLMIFGMTIAMVLLDIELLSLFQKS